VDTVPFIPNAAAKVLERKWSKDQARALQEAKKDLDANQYFLRCPRIYDHHAAYLTERPGSNKIHPGMWFNLEHEAGEPWALPYITCQECLAEGEQRRWNVHLRPYRLQDGNMVFELQGEEKLLIGKVSRTESDKKRDELSGVTEEEVEVPRG
jgi:hypothetical protein